MAQKLINEAILSLGSNLGDRRKNLENCISFIQQKIGKLTAISNYLENPAMEFDSEKEFINVCVKVNTNSTGLEILNQIKWIEKQMGRTSTRDSYEDRIIDIDIILLNDLIFESKELIIPHSKYQKRSFVLIPMLELGNYQDPKIFITGQQFLK